MILIRLIVGIIVLAATVGFMWGWQYWREEPDQLGYAIANAFGGAVLAAMGMILVTAVVFVVTGDPLPLLD